MLPKPVSPISASACSRPHIAPSPAPFCASETVMQCMHETVYSKVPSGCSRFRWT
jgi:hypothetical protein